MKNTSLVRTIPSLYFLLENAKDVRLGNYRTGYPLQVGWGIAVEGGAFDAPSICR